MAKAIYAFSGDPITYGHLDIIRRAAQVFDQLVVAIGLNPDKKYLFTLEERTDLAEQAVSKFSNVQVVSFRGLLVDFAYEIGADVIVKGVRNPSDFEYETSLHRVGDSQELGIDTFILIADPKKAHISSSAVKQIQKEQGLIHEYVPLVVKQAVEKKISGQYIVSLTGEIGAGKSYVSQQFAQLGQKQGLEVHNIELDHLTHQIYQELTEPKYHQIRDTIAQTFGQQVRQEDGTINRKVLGEIVFNDYDKLRLLNEIMEQPLMVRIRRELYGKTGLILLNAALIIEAQMTYLSNNHICLVKTDEATQRQRLERRDLTPVQIKRRLDSQYTFEEKKRNAQEIIEQEGFGKFWIVDNVQDATEPELEKVFKQLVVDLELV
ncbi:MAG: pantetheine-phosphate adenylyltransferase [Candidatus Pacebacteria bacterium]|nr:pantetheine-phosphate adenylyltransferase [Candidatus Paceibacterota bacterium]